jgi:RNA polymerase sigma factor (sigma-70 family)
MIDLPLEHIIHGCSKEAERQDRTSEAGYCFELFRRALEDQDDGAWEAIQSQYNRLVLQWCYAFENSLDQIEGEEIAREALERFWRTLRTVHIADRFDHVGALLKYLNQCVISTILDHRRQEERKRRLMERIKLFEAPAQFSPSPEREALDRMVHEEQFQRIRDWIQSNITDPKEQLVLRDSFEYDLKPSEIAQRHPEIFPDVQTVRQIKERILKRLRRALAE